MRGSPADRVAGAVGLLVSIAVAFEARGFAVGFVTDPIGPRGLPWLSAGLLAAGSLALIVRPATAPVPWPSRSAGGRIAALVGVLVVASVSIETLGFVLATTLLMTVAGRLFGGRWLRSAGGGLLLAVLLFYFFAWGLGVPLPVGVLGVGS